MALFIVCSTSRDRREVRGGQPPSGPGMTSQMHAGRGEVHAGRGEGMLGKLIARGRAANWQSDRNFPVICF